MGQHYALLWLIERATGTFPLPDAMLPQWGSFIIWQIQQMPPFRGGIILYRSIILALQRYEEFLKPPNILLTNCRYY